GRRARTSDVGTRVALLLRLAEIQHAWPDKAIAALEHALELDPNALGAAERRALAEQYDRAGVQGTRVLANHVEVLAADPLERRSLAALARHYEEQGDPQRAHALYEVLALRDPDNEAARGYLDSVVVSGGGQGELQIASVVPSLPSDGGIGDALLALLDGGTPILAEYLPRIEVPPEARISPLGEGLLAQCWGEVLKRLGMSKVALVAQTALGDGPEDGPEVEDGDWLEVRCQQPPIIVARPPAFEVDDADGLRFALARALYSTRPEAVFAIGLRRATLGRLISAILQAFHPRHSRRKHHQRPEDFVARLSQELLRKLPMRSSRQLGQLFKDHEDEPFDSRQWRAWIRRAGNRVGLAVAGDLGAAIRVVTRSTATPTGDTLVELAQADDDLRDLIAFAASAAYAAVRQQLGYEIRTRG
ncbi:MAG TPA: hypothetical protein VG755_21870, partial [Nannocystaceae bacterium]|nr:hypothetical protein [Nannocystaceae bacterium]